MNFTSLLLAKNTRFETTPTVGYSLWTDNQQSVDESWATPVYMQTKRPGKDTIQPELHDQ